MNKQQIAQAKASWGMHLQPHFAPPPPKALPRIVGYDFDTRMIEPLEKAWLHYQIEHSLARKPELRHLSILPVNSMLVMVTHPLNRLQARVH